MTEAEWLSANDPDEMLDHLQVEVGAARRPAGRRKLRLFACACCRRIWHLLDEGGRKAVAAAEGFAEGLVDRHELARARQVAAWNRGAFARADPLVYAAWEAGRLVTWPLDVQELARQVARWAALAVRVRPPGTMRGIWWGEGPDPDEGLNPAERAAQADLLREVFGNPFDPLPRRPFSADLRSLARSCQGDRALFPVLADALDDLGAEGPAGHLRQEGHVKGCHVLDWVLGRG
jgi:hypothetical protein